MSPTKQGGDAARVGADHDAEPVLRRAPFSDNPEVGARGQRTRQRIIDAALETFGERGYRQCSIDRITKLAGCSRVSFYQYFSGKEDLFRHLSGQVARQLSASTEALGPLTADTDGWRELRAWVDRYTAVYERYEPVFHAYADAAEADEVVAGGSARTLERNVARIRSRLTTDLPARQLDAVVERLLECVSRTHNNVGLLRSLAPDAYAPERVGDALTDVMHRTFFGLRPDVNVQPIDDGPVPRFDFGPAISELLRDGQDGGDLEDDTLSDAGRRTRDAITEAGREVFVRRGYHRTRVDDIVAEAGVSHGAFYRYYPSKEALAQVLAVQAMTKVSATLVAIPDLAGNRDRAGGAGAPTRNGALTTWLRRYHTAHATESAVLQVWVDASLQNAELRPDAAAALDWGRRAMARYLEPRGFGDVDAESVILITLLATFGARPRSAADTDAVAHIIHRGLLGQ